MKSKSIKLLAATILSAMVVVAGCASPNKDNNDAKEEGFKAVTIDNFDQKTTYNAKPENVVCLSINSAEIIAALGEGATVKAVQESNNKLDDVLPEYRDQLKDTKIPAEINTGMPPTLEAMLALEPDLVALNSFYFRVPFFGKIDDYKANNINIYVTEGTYVSGCTIENTYNDIKNLGAIFGKTEKAQELIDNMKDSLKKVSDKVDSAEKVKVMAFDSMSDDGLYNITGGTGLENELIKMAGADNVFADVASDFSAVSIEEIIARNPEYIIIHNYTSTPDDDKTKINYLKSQPELSEVPAIKNDKFIVVSMFQITPGLQNVNFVENVAKAVHADLFK